MKNILIATVFFMFYLPGFCQDSVLTNGRATPSITKEKVKHAKSITDIMPEFCRFVSMIYYQRSILDNELGRLNQQASMAAYIPGKTSHSQSDFYALIDIVSVEIKSTSAGIASAAKSSGEVLTPEQKKILLGADLGSNALVDIKFMYKNQNSGKDGDRKKLQEGQYVVAVVPDKEAAFPGGLANLSNYLKDIVVNKASDKNSAMKIQGAVVKFSITEKGEVVDAKITQTSTDLKIDKLLLDAVNDMPQWKPAEDLKGTKLKQEFNVSFVGDGC
ncbi:MAG: hypothetical protein KA444_05880 [Bacteroidia bacterium]|nr:hypothetical protein [Bacteroidia bacterium]